MATQMVRAVVLRARAQRKVDILVPPLPTGLLGPLARRSEDEEHAYLRELFFKREMRRMEEEEEEEEEALLLPSSPAGDFDPKEKGAGSKRTRRHAVLRLVGSGLFLFPQTQLSG